MSIHHTGSTHVVVRRLHQELDAYEAETFDEAIGVLRRHPDIDLMLVDLIMPGFDSFAGLRRLRAAFPEVPVVVVSVHEDIDHVIRSVEQGVIGYIPKSASGPEVERALERIMAGEVYFPRRIIERAPPSPAPPGRDGAAAVHDGDDPLTNREREVIGLLGRGFSVKRIAEDLGLSNHTVRVHIGNLMKKLGLSDRAAAIHYAVGLHNEAQRGRSG